MAQYIDKDALVAEIVKMLQEEYPCDNSEQTTGYHCALYELQDFINSLEVIEIGVDLGDPKGDKSAKYIIDTDTIEVKEVDLEKEIQRQYNVHKNPDNSIAKDCVIMTKDGFEYFAKYFFELGLNASNPLTWEDVKEICVQSVLVEIDLGGLVSDERHYTEVLKRFKERKEK